MIGYGELINMLILFLNPIAKIALHPSDIPEYHRDEGTRVKEGRKK